MSTNTGRGSVAAALMVGLLACAASAQPAASKPAMEWQQVAAKLPGGPASMAMAPDGSQIVIGVMRKGFYGSADGGVTWEKLGKDDKEQIISLCTDVVFDPKDSKTFWVSGAYEHSIFKTTDGGKTFLPQGPLWHLDNIAVDFSDPERQVLVAGMHESPGKIFRSVDGGKKWYSLGKARPGLEGFPQVYGPNSPVILDAQTYVIGCNPGWMSARGNKPAIVRTEDGGVSWTKVSDAGPTENAFVASDGAIYWPLEKGMLRSADRGKTWEKIDAVSATPVELPNKKLISANGKQLLVSADAGKTWEKLGPAAPDSLRRLMYNPKEQSIYAASRGNDRTPTKIYRLAIGE